MPYLDSFRHLLKKEPYITTEGLLALLTNRLWLTSTVVPERGCGRNGKQNDGARPSEAWREEEIFRANGDSYDNALAETVIGLFKTKVIHRRRPWRSFNAVEYATLEWVDWFNNRRLLEPIGNIPPAEAEAQYYAALEKTKMAA